MQKRSCDRWLGVLCTIASVGLMVQLAGPSSAWAAPKKKKGKHAAAAQVEPEAPASTSSSSSSSSEDKNVDDLMDDTSKSKSVRQQRADDEAADKAATRSKTEKEVGEPDAWERPPAEEEKPKKKSKFAAEPEVKKGDDRKWAIEINAGYGFETTKYFAGDPYGLGGGLHGTYEFEFHLVVGLGAMVFLGSSGTSYDSPGPGVPIQAIPFDVRYWLGYAEVGYSFWFSDNSIILRPSLWVGLGWGVQDPPMASASSGVITSLMLAPGLTLDFLLGSSGWYLGADVHFLVMTGDGASGLPLMAKFGKRF